MPTYQQGAEDFLGSTVYATSVALSAVVNIRASDMLIITGRIVGYGGNDVAILRFNGDATAGNYLSRFITFSALSATTTAAAAQTNITFTGIPVSDQQFQLGRVFRMVISNRLATNKMIEATHADEVTPQATGIPLMSLGFGQWFNTAAQITSVQMTTQGGQTLNAGTGFRVTGYNF